MSISSKLSVVTSKRRLGNEGETLVQQYLLERDFSITATNFSVRGGEVDIIASKKDLIVFVEVKTRTKNYFNTSEVITLTKQKKIIFAAKMFISRHGLVESTYRFDVALVDGQNNVTYIEHAFCESYE